MITRFGVIGYGHIGRRHAGIIQKHPNCQLVSICDKVTIEPISGVTHYSSVDAMLASESLDVVCICSPNGLHASHTLLALNSDVHVICEKPLALTSADCRAMADKAKFAKKQIVCVLQNRYSPQIHWLKSIVEEGLLGDIYQTQINCFWNRDDRYYRTAEGTPHPWRGTRDLDGGPLYTQFSHFVDVMIWLLGVVSVESAQFKNFNHKNIQFEDTGHFTFKWSAQSMGSFHYSIAVWDKNQESSITLIGSKGSVRIGGQYMNQVEYCHIENYQLPELSGAPEVNDYNGYRGSANNHFFVIQNMVDVLQHAITPDFDIADAINCVALIEQVYQYRNK